MLWATSIGAIGDRVADPAGIAPPACGSPRAPAHYGRLGGDRTRERRPASQGATTRAGRRTHRTVSPSGHPSGGVDLVVVGAGVIGSWTALRAREAGLSVVLVDAWGPGNIRSSSGDETRILRSSYGTD